MSQTSAKPDALRERDNKEVGVSGADQKRKLQVGDDAAMDALGRIAESLERIEFMLEALLP